MIYRLPLIWYYPCLLLLLYAAGIGARRRAGLVLFVRQLSTRVTQRTARWLRHRKPE